MFIRVTTYEFDQGREGDIAAWADTKTREVQAIDGLVSVDAYNTAPGHGAIVAVYDDEPSYEKAAPTITAVLGQLGAFLTKPPTTLSGAPFWTTRERVDV